MDSTPADILELEEESTLPSNPKTSTKLIHEGLINVGHPTNDFSAINRGKSKRLADDELYGHHSKKPSTPPFSHPQLTPQDDSLPDRADLEKKLSPEPSPKENQPPKIMKENPVPKPVLPHVRVTIEDLKRSSMLHTSGPIILRSKGNVVPPPLIPLNAQPEINYLDKGPWLQMLSDHHLPPFGGQRLQCNIAWILNRGYRYKIPSLVVSLKSFIPKDTGAAIVARDPSGEIDGYLDSAATKQFQDQLGAGCVLILKGITVFNPDKTHYLNIARAMISSVIPPSTPLPIDTPPNIVPSSEDIYVSQREMEQFVVASSSPLPSPQISSPYAPVSSAAAYAYTSSIQIPPTAPAAKVAATLPAPNSKAAAVRSRTAPALPADHSPLVGSPTKTPTKPPPAPQTPQPSPAPASTKPLVVPVAVTKPSQPTPAPLPTPAVVKLVPPAAKPPPSGVPITKPAPPPAPSSVNPPTPITVVKPVAVTKPPPPSPTPVTKPPPLATPPTQHTIPSIVVKPPPPPVMKPPAPLVQPISKPPPPLPKSTLPLKPPAVAQVVKPPPPVAKKPSGLKPPPVAATFVSGVAASSPLMRSPMPLSSQVRPIMHAVQIAPPTAAFSSEPTAEHESQESEWGAEERDELEGVQPHEEDFDFHEYEEDSLPLEHATAPQIAAATTSEDQFDEFADPELDALLAQNPDVLKGT